MRSSYLGIKVGVLISAAVIVVPYVLKFILHLFDRKVIRLPFERFLELDAQGKILLPANVSGNEIYGFMIDEQGVKVPFYTLQLDEAFADFIHHNRLTYETIFEGTPSSFLLPVTLLCSLLAIPLFIFTLLRNHRLWSTVEYWSAFKTLARQATHTEDESQFPWPIVLEKLASEPKTAKAFARHRYLLDSLQRIASANTKWMRTRSLLAGIPTLSFIESAGKALNEIFFPPPLSETLPLRLFDKAYCQYALSLNLEDFWKQDVTHTQLLAAAKKDGTLSVITAIGLAKWQEAHNINGISNLREIQMPDFLEQYENPPNVLFVSTEFTQVDLDLFLEANPKIIRPLLLVFTEDGTPKGNPIGWIQP